MTAPGQLDRRRRRSLATRAALRRTALQLVAEHGLEQVSIEQITQRADVGYRTFFNHFASKEDALIEPGDERAAHLVAGLEQRPPDEVPLEAMRAVLLAEATAIEERTSEYALRFAVLEANPALMRRFFAEFAVLDRAIVEALARRTGQDPAVSLYPHLLASVAVTALRTSFLRWRSAGAEREQSAGSLRALVAEAFDLLAAGMADPATGSSPR